MPGAGAWSRPASKAKAIGALKKPRGWTRQAVLRAAPVAMVFYRLIVVWFARQGQRGYQPLARPEYGSKHAPSFADMLATLRGVSAREQIIQIPDPLHAQEKTLEILLQILKLAALCAKVKLTVAAMMEVFP